MPIHMADIGTVGNASARLGQELGTLLTTPALKQEDLDAKLGGYVQTAENQVQRAQGLDPPGPLFDAHQGAVEALEFRVNGMRGLRTAFQQTANATDATEVGQTLSTHTARLLASDVIWADAFKATAESVLEEESVDGVDAPASEFVTADDVTTASSLAAIWKRIQGASTGGTPTGLHGNQITYVKALPSGQLLSTTTIATILVTDELAFEVGVEDSGDSQEVRVKVTLTIPKQPKPIVKTSTIPLIDPGETKAHLITDIASHAPRAEAFRVLRTNLQFSEVDTPLRTILVTNASHPYVAAWWPPGHIIGYEHEFTHAVADFLTAMEKGAQIEPNLCDGMKGMQVLEAAVLSATTGCKVAVAEVR